jgi:hypothetical protein
LNLFRSENRRAGRSRRTAAPPSSTIQFTNRPQGRNNFFPAFWPNFGRRRAVFGRENNAESDSLVEILGGGSVLAAAPRRVAKTRIEVRSRPIAAGAFFVFRFRIASGTGRRAAEELCQPLRRELCGEEKLSSRQDCRKSL